MDTELPTNPNSCFDIFTSGLNFSINIPCIILILVGWLAVGLSIGLFAYFIYINLCRGIPRRLERKKLQSIEEARLESIIILSQLGVPPEEM